MVFHVQADSDTKRDGEVSIEATDPDTPPDRNNLLPCIIIDDGYLYLSRASKAIGSNRFSKVPVIRYEVSHLFRDSLV